MAEDNVAQEIPVRQKGQSDRLDEHLHCNTQHALELGMLHAEQFGERKTLLGSLLVPCRDKMLL